MQEYRNYYVYCKMFSISHVLNMINLLFGYSVLGSYFPVTLFLYCVTHLLLQQWPLPIHANKADLNLCKCV